MLSFHLEFESVIHLKMTLMFCYSKCKTCVDCEQLAHSEHTTISLLHTLSFHLNLCQGLIHNFVGCSYTQQVLTRHTKTMDFL